MKSKMAALNFVTFSLLVSFIVHCVRANETVDTILDESLLQKIIKNQEEQNNEIKRLKSTIQRQQDELEQYRQFHKRYPSFIFDDVF